MDVRAIQEILPHRYPFLLVDRVVEAGEGRLVAWKNVTANEAFFTGHFPGHPVMPGVLIVEAMAQAGALLAYHMGGFEDRERKVTYLMGLDKVRFRQPVVPGDRLEIEVVLLRHKGSIFKQGAVARVDGKKVAECELLATVRERDEA
ncbi:MAG: 3-hydroxyacyl-[acyl-carrier-protein] dehydratase FabZ [Deltaproteobacteria bacterium]|nr:MAG: 3-hydroxyacyl-[acyl-carrier-protein] dehydratase FabZ [Deltaproteobacteria bacterium]